MLLTGLTLEVQGMVAVNEERLPVTLETQFLSPGLRAKMREWLSGGIVGIYDIVWIEDKLYLQLHPSLDVLSGPHQNYGAKLAGRDVTLDVTVQGLEH